jgi:hypothetical protein
MNLSADMRVKLLLQILLGIATSPERSQGNCELLTASRAHPDGGSGAKPLENPQGALRHTHSFTQLDGDFHVSQIKFYRGRKFRKHTKITEAQQ